MRSTLTTIITAVTLSFAVLSCDHPLDKDEIGNCTDGLQNQYEDGVDCGGPCLPCASCEDGIQNGGETGIDCGGACLSCVPTCSLQTGKLTYTIHPQGFSSPFDETQPLSYDGYLSVNTIDFTIGQSASSVFKKISVTLNKDLDLKTLLSVNQTAVFTTTQDIFAGDVSKGQINVEIRGSLGFSSYNQELNRNQKVFITRLSNTKFELQFCESSADADVFVFRGTFG